MFGNVGHVLYSWNQHKAKRFRKDDNLIISSNEAFQLSDSQTRKRYTEQYNKSKSLYVNEKPEFEEILKLISIYAKSL